MDKKRVHKKIYNKLNELDDDVKALASKALSLSSRTNPTNVAETLFDEINKIDSIRRGD